MKKMIHQANEKASDSASHWGMSCCTFRVEFFFGSAIGRSKVKLCIQLLFLQDKTSSDLLQMQSRSLILQSMLCNSLWWDWWSRLAAGRFLPFFFRFFAWSLACSKSYNYLANPLMTLHLLVVLRLRIPKRLFLSQKEVPTWRYINSKSGRILPFGREEIRFIMRSSRIAINITKMRLFSAGPF